MRANYANYFATARHANYNIRTTITCFNSKPNISYRNVNVNVCLLNKKSIRNKSIAIKEFVLESKIYILALRGELARLAGLARFVYISFVF